jgi:curli biogenesis system outer membrane secretion channel CsgG
MKNKIYLLLLGLLLSAITACAPDTVVIKQDYDFTKIKKIAVLEFKSSQINDNSGAMASDIVAKYLLKGGYTVVARADLVKLMAEKHLDVSGVIDESQMKEIGKLSGVDAIITGSVPVYTPARKEVVLVRMKEFTTNTTYNIQNDQVRTDPNKPGEQPRIENHPRETQAIVTSTMTDEQTPVTHTIQAEIGVTCKMIDVSTGEVVWAASDTYEGANIQAACEYLVSSMIDKLVKQINKPRKK